MSTEAKSIYWKKHINAWRTSQMTQQDYCKQNGLSFASFGYWRTRLKKLSQPQSGANHKLIPVSVVGAAPSVSLWLPSAIRMEVPAHALSDILPVLYRVLKDVA